jgi:hypothetical protein
VARPQVQVQGATLAGALPADAPDSQTAAPFPVALLERGTQLLAFSSNKDAGDDERSRDVVAVDFNPLPTKRGKGAKLQQFYWLLGLLAGTHGPAHLTATLSSLPGFTRAPRVTLLESTRQEAQSLSAEFR